MKTGGPVLCCGIEKKGPAQVQEKDSRCSEEQVVASVCGRGPGESCSNPLFWDRRVLSGGWCYQPSSLHLQLRLHWAPCVCCTGLPCERWVGCGLPGGLSEEESGNGASRAWDPDTDCQEGQQSLEVCRGLSEVPDVSGLMNGGRCYCDSFRGVRNGRLTSEPKKQLIGPEKDF